MNKTRYLHRIAIILSFALVLSLTACAGAGTGTTPGDSPPPASNEAPAAQGEPTPAGDGMLTVMVPNNYLPYMEAVKAGFEEETGIMLDIVEREDGNILETLQLDGAAGIGPDVTILPPDRIGQFAAQETIARYTLPDDGRFSDSDILLVTVGGDTYGALMQSDCMIMFYNKDLLPDGPPRTFAELEALSDDPFYSEDGASIAFYTAFMAPFQGYGMIAAYGGYLFGDNGTNSDDIGLNNSGAVEAVEYMKSWYDRWPAGYLDSQAYLLANERFTTGRTAALISGLWDAEGFLESGINLGAAKIPTLPNGSEYMPFIGGRVWVISNFSNEKDNAAKLLDYLTNESSQQLLYDMRNEIPTHVTVRENILKGDDELVKAVIAQLPFAIPSSGLPEMAEFWTIVYDMLFDAVSGSRSVQDALDFGVQTYKEIIEQKYR